MLARRGRRSIEIARLPEVDSVMAAIVGAAGLRSTFAAARAGKRLLLANKESLVMAGPLLMQARARRRAPRCCRSTASTTPFSSACRAMRARGEAPPGVSRILLTASGGPFLTRPRARSARAPPKQACAHPNWVMGRKISVDSATLMNKGLELIEACLLFGVTPRQVEVVIHRAEHRALAGGIRRRLGARAARFAGHAHADRVCAGVAGAVASGVQFLDLIRSARLEFEAPDLRRFPALALAQEAARAGGLQARILNAANEVAVPAFLEGD